MRINAAAVDEPGGIDVLVVQMGKVEELVMFFSHCHEGMVFLRLLQTLSCKLDNGTR